ncbi:DNA methyltransferase [Alphaproteobacteria bacterium US3C007]|nr:DNA methyltransferase [Alphaproteobacteria bacterium US3C007]
MDFFDHKIVSVSDLIPYVLNSRSHSDEQVAQIASSIREFGFTNPVLVDADNNLIAGHGRVLAARKINLETVPAIVVTGLDDRKRRALVIADNKLALNADWDEAALRVELKDLAGDFGELMGFSEDELVSLLKQDASEGLTDEDAVPDAPEQPVTVEGDVWVLGNHRLMCGDSTSIDAVENLMDGKAVDMVFTDPPYNVSFNGRSGKHDVIKNDNLSEQDFSDFIEGTIATIKAVNPAVYYIWCNWNFYGILQGKLDYKTCIVWAKNVFGMGSGYRHQHEFCLFNGKIDETIKNESDLWSVKKDHGYVHPTQKPVELSVRAFGNHIKLLDVLDLFGGSGSTMIGAEQTGRNCYMMELDPKYCDVIIQRWQDYTGKQAALEATGQKYDELTLDRCKAA